MKTDLLVCFVTTLILLVTASLAQAEVPCDAGYVYSCNEYRICGCKPVSSGGGLDVVVAAATAESGSGNDLLIVNNGDGSDFLEKKKNVLKRTGAYSEEVVIELGLAAGLSEDEIVALLLPAIQQAR